jgi:uncharacterized SAM-binding protein YcdF (DUF218 family)
VLPPGCLILLALIGLALMRTRVRFGAGLVMFSLIALYALSTPIVGSGLLRSLQPPYSDPAGDATPGAIVILGGGVNPRAPEYDSDNVSHYTLERVRYGAHLQRRTGKPILVTGGNPAGNDLTEAEAMKRTLREFGASAEWLEDASDNTFQSALLSARILKKAGVQSIYLVTHAWHMPRARMVFERAGLHVVPALMAYSASGRVRVLDFMPSGYALHKSFLFFHEVLGMFWYRLRFDLGR